MSFRIIVGLICLLFFTSVSAQQAFTVHDIVGGPTNLRPGFSLVAVDLNQDGFLDLVSGGEVAWHKNDGAGNFVSYKINDIGDGLSWAAVADMDGDNDLDVVSVGGDQYNVYLHKNDGSENFSLSIVGSDLDRPRNLFLMDMNNDSDIDILVTASSPPNDKIVYYENLGNGLFNLIEVSNPREIADIVYPVDFDADGDIDVFAARFNDISLYQNNGGQGFSRIILAEDRGFTYSMWPTDIDGDNDIDLLHTSSDMPSIFWLSNDGNGSFTDGTLINDSAFCTYAAVKDLDLDGDPDIIASSWTTNAVYVYENTGSNIFNRETITSQPVQGGIVVSGDFDGNGELDYATLNSELSVHLANGNSGYTSRKIWGSVNQPVQVKSADMNGDGLPDLLSLSSLDSKMALYTNSFGEYFDNIDISLSLRGRNGLDTGDMDNDQDIDIIASNQLPGELIWYENVGSSTFQSHTILEQAERIQSPKLIDFNLDGHLDIVCYLATDRKLILLMNDGLQNFILSEIYTNSFQANMQIETVDLNMDGKEDILTTIFSKFGRVIWFKNLGNGQASFNLINQRKYARHQKPVDFDRDGYIDIGLISNSNNIGWLENDGNENFTFDTIDSIFTFPSDIEFVDLDADDDYDIVVAYKFQQHNSGSIGWLENLGNGHFTRRVIATTSSALMDIELADVNMDGRMDFFASERYGDRIAWYENLGPSTPIGNDNLVVPTELTLHQNYPNPFNPTTTIAFDLAVASNVNLTVYDIRGREVATLLNEPRLPGYHEVDFDASELSSGVYVYRLETEALSETRKMLLIR